MKYLVKIVFGIVLCLALSACSTGSGITPAGVNCNYSTDKPIWDLPLVCQPNGG